MDLKKMLLVSVAILALAGIGTAWSLGNTLTPEEFVNIDLDKHNFNPIPKETKIIGEGTEGAVYRIDVEINSFDKTSPTEYEEKILILAPQFGVRSYLNCRATGTIETDCDEFFGKTLATEAAYEIIQNEESLKTEQVTASRMALYAAELKPGDITITAEEINAEIVRIKALELEEP